MNNSPTPQSSRRFMDFAPRSKAARAPRPVSAMPEMPPKRAPQAPRPQPVRPAAAPVRPTPMSRPLAPQAPRSQVARPQPPRPQTHVVHERVESTTILYPAAHTTPKRRPVVEDDYLDIESSALGVIEDLGSSAKADTPDNASFVLGGHSPFINTDKVAKRPLSSHLPKEKPVDKIKNIYDKSVKSSRKPTKTAKNAPTVVSGSASRGNSISLVIAIILTVILGAIVGTFIYLAFFQ